MMITQRRITEDGMRSLVKNINNLLGFVATNIRFHHDIQHFVDRLEDRHICLMDVAPVVLKAIKNHLCEVIFYAYLEDRPIRFNIKTDKFVVGLTCHTSLNSGKQVFKFRTIIPNYKGRFDSRISTFVLDMDK